MFFVAWARQKAPSAKRCIMTGARSTTGSRSIGGVRKHRAPKGALRQEVSVAYENMLTESESTERQKVH